MLQCLMPLIDVVGVGLIVTAGSKMNSARTALLSTGTDEM